jgi:thiol-disulfide isomerase/thioredoxin
MRAIPRSVGGWFLVIGFAATFVFTERDSPARAADAPPGVDLRVVKYDALTDAIKAQKGKVVVVDVWAEFCSPCKKEFPNLVALHQRYAKDGLVCISVTVDAPGRRDDALKFLTKTNATFANFLIDEKPDVWQDKWKLYGPPAVFVFGRDGRRAAKYDSNDPDQHYTYDDVEKLVKDLLRENP